MSFYRHRTPSFTCPPVRDNPTVITARCTQAHPNIFGQPLALEEQIRNFHWIGASGLKPVIRESVLESARVLYAA